MITVDKNLQDFQAMIFISLVDLQNELQACNEIKFLFAVSSLVIYNVIKPFWLADLKQKANCSHEDAQNQNTKKGEKFFA